MVVPLIRAVFRFGLRQRDRAPWVGGLTKAQTAQSVACPAVKFREFLFVGYPVPVAVPQTLPEVCFWLLLRHWHPTETIQSLKILEFPWISRPAA